MQIENVKISNLLTFPYRSNLQAEDGISFLYKREWLVNILIWPNGSGKSSFLEIINQVFKVWLMKDYVYNKKFLYSKKKSDLKNVIIEHRLHLKNLQKNFAFMDKKSLVYLTLNLSQNDFDNLRFICKFSNEINAIINKYSKLKVTFWCINLKEIWKFRRIKLRISVNIKNKKITLNKKDLSTEEEFILQYLLHQELVQICMNIFNDVEKKAAQRRRYPLKNTFAILGANRDFWDIIENDEDLIHISPKTWSMYISGQNTKTHYSVSIWYYLCMMKLWDVVNLIQKKCMSFQNNKFTELYEDIYKKELEKSWFYTELSALIYKYLGMSLDVDYINDNFVFLLKSKDWYKFHFNQLSSGVQSFLMIIMTVYGYDLDSWLMIIDEPELHLHPQMQNEFISFINYVSKKFSLQIIFATHSPLMVNEENIHNVYRFTKSGISTDVIHPSLKISADESDLVHMLKFENISKIFFVDKIILVEWETDVYRFDHYLKYLKTLPSWKDKILEYEILNIHGKGSYRRWRKFLSKFNIDSYFIWDWDNIVDQKIITDAEFHSYNKKANKYYRFLKSTQKYVDKRHYGILVDMIKIYYPKEYNYILEQIEWLYVNNIFLLKDWDLETYMWMKTKWLDDVILFCQKKFLNWYKNDKYIGYRAEVEGFFKKMFDI